MIRGVLMLVATAVALAASTGCAPSVTPGPAFTVTVPATGPAELPALTGVGSLAALQTLRGNGFQAIGFQDSSASPGRDWSADHRAGRSWTVCFQAPAAGERDRAREVILGIVPPGQACPEHDAGWEYSAYDSRSIDWTGSSVESAADALRWQGPLTLVNVRNDKKVKLDTRGDWTVCAVESSAEADPVTIRASAEAC